MEFIQEFKDNCNVGKHDLIEIAELPHSWDGSSQLVKWCQICGAVVVDLEIDGRVTPGHYMKMKFPKQIYQK